MYPHVSFRSNSIAVQWRKLLHIKLISLVENHVLRSISHIPQWIKYPTMHHFVTELCKCEHILLQRGALWEMGLVHCGIFLNVSIGGAFRGLLSLTKACPNVQVCDCYYIMHLWNICPMQQITLTSYHIQTTKFIIFLHNKFRKLHFSISAVNKLLLHIKTSKCMIVHDISKMILKVWSLN